MAIDAIVKFSQQSDTPTYQAINNALVGHPQDPSRPGPFTRVGTSAYSCMCHANDMAILDALSNAMAAAVKHATFVDSMQISFVHHKPNSSNTAGLE